MQIGPSWIEVERSRRHNPLHGWETVVRFHGWDDTAGLFASQLRSEAAEVEVRNLDGPKREITATFHSSLDNSAVADEEELASTWELSSNLIEESIEKHPRMLALERLYRGSVRWLRAYSEAHIAAVEAAAQAGSGTLATGDAGVFAPPSSALWTVLQSAQAQAFCERWIAGRRTYSRSQPVLRNRKELPAGSSLRADVRQLGTYIPSRNLSTIGLPAEIRFTLPTTGVWETRAPIVSQMSNGRWEIIQEYWFYYEADDFPQTI